HRGRRVEEDDAALARPLQRLRDPPPHARALERRARGDEADGACGGVGSRRGELEARAPAARAGEGADEQRQQKPSWPAMHSRPGEPMSGKNHAWCLVVVQAGSMGMRPSAGANASSLAWRSDKKMTVPGLLGRCRGSSAARPARAPRACSLLPTSTTCGPVASLPSALALAPGSPTPSHSYLW